MSNQKNRFAIIMAGGSGERFWPLSRHNKPKQLLRLTDPDCSMLEEAVQRIAPVVSPEHVYIVTGRHLVDPIREAEVGVPDENVIAEPAKRNTSGALAYATAVILARHPDADPEGLGIAVVTADHRIEQHDDFRATVVTALSAAEQEQALVTIGIEPAWPETGYGYIQAGDPAEGAGEGAVFRVTDFHEKPEREKAEAFVAAGNYYWNSGMFFWTAGAFLNELRQASPNLAQATEDMREAMKDDDADRVEEIFGSLEDISIDHALMEKAGNVLVTPGAFRWADVGALPSLADSHPLDEHGNCLVGDPVVQDSRDCIVYNDTGPGRIAVGVRGMDNVAVIVTEDAVLVIPKDRCQEVRHIVDDLKDRDATQI